MKIMFWNAYKNAEINQAICDIAWENEVNIIALAEYEGNIDHLTRRLAANDLHMEKYFSAGCDKIIILGDVSDIEPGTQADRYSIQIVRGKYLLCAVHLPSQIYSGHQKRREIIIRQIIEDIERSEKEMGTKYSIVVGDINEDPYEDGCLSADNFHGLPCHSDALREKRIVEGKIFSMFYNPMWNFFGDFNSPPGTYYYQGSKAKNSFWHIFDQVMIRPCLKDEFVKESLKIVTSAGIESLLDEKGRPDKRFSDHLPIIFEIKEEY